MRLISLTIAAVAIALGAGAPVRAASNDGFAAFWKAFAAAVGKDDKPALTRMTVLGPGLADNMGTLTFDKFHAAYLKLSERRCLARAKPVRGVDGTGAVNYSVGCGQLIYVFTLSGGAWRLTDLSPDD